MYPAIMDYMRKMHRLSWLAKKLRLYDRGGAQGLIRPSSVMAAANSREALSLVM